MYRCVSLSLELIGKGRQLKPILLLSCIELSIGVSCACLPSLNVLIQRLRSTPDVHDRNHKRHHWWPHTARRKIEVVHTCPHCAVQCRAQITSSNIHLDDFERELAVWTGTGMSSTVGKGTTTNVVTTKEDWIKRNSTMAPPDGRVPSELSARADEVAALEAGLLSSTS